MRSLLFLVAVFVARTLSTDAVFADPVPVTTQSPPIAGKYTGIFYDSNTKAHRNFTLTISTVANPTNVPSAATNTPDQTPIHGTLLFSNGQGDDGLYGMVTTAPPTSFTLGWDNTNGTMQFDGNLLEKALFGTWRIVVKPSGAVYSGTFNAARKGH